MNKSFGPDPRNPYHSYVVSASAGSGKTYQLSQRFLYLVGAGALPSQILTISFTVKAATEMRERILGTAAALLANTALAKEFDQTLAQFLSHSAPSIAKAPLKAHELGRLILDQSQSLSIMTMDAVFLDWLRKYPLEASDPEILQKLGLSLPSPFRLLEPSRAKKLSEKSLRLAFEKSTEAFSDHVFEAFQKIDFLQKNHTLIWLWEKRGLPALGLHKLSLKSKEYESLWQDSAVLLQALASGLKAEKKAALLGSLKSLDRGILQELNLLTKEGLISKASFRGKAFEPYREEIESFNQSLTEALDQPKLSELNRKGSQLFELYKRYSEARDRLKYSDALLEFHDAAKGAWQIFRSNEAAPARFLIHLRYKHLLLDEFQDTSWLQWGVFREMSSEWLAGQGLDSDLGLAPSVFIVGDEKQSIYGFREADPEILKVAADELKSQSAVVLSLNQSYRSAPTLLRFLNACFGSEYGLREFPEHRPATLADGRHLIPDVAQVGLFVLEEGGPESEARQMAEWVKCCLDSPEFKVPLRDGSFRALEPQDIAILYRASTHAEVYEAALRAQGLAVRREEGYGFYSRADIKDLLNLLRLFAYPSDTHALAVVLKGPLVGLSDQALIAALAEIQRDLPESWDNPRARRLWEKALLAAPEPLEPFRDWLLTHRFSSVVEILSSLTSELFFLESLKRNYPDKDPREIEGGLRQLLQLAYHYQSKGMILPAPFLSYIETEALDEVQGSFALGTQAIQLMTIHKSKGLEFPMVILAGAAQAWDQKDRYWIKAQDQKAAIYFIGTQAQQAQAHKEFRALLGAGEELLRKENQRLLYVALTRAKHWLYLGGSLTRVKKEALSPYQQVELALDQLGVPKASDKMRILQGHFVVPDSVDLSPKNPSAELPWEWQPLPSDSIPRQIRSVAPHRLLAYGSQLGNAPARRTLHYGAQAAYGTLVHKGLEQLCSGKSLDLESYWADLSLRLPPSWTAGAYERGLEEIRSSFHRPAFQELLNAALRVECEREILCLDRKSLIHGHIDLLCYYPEKVLIIDFKTTEDAKDLCLDAMDQWVKERAFEAQLEAYAAALRRIMPGKLIEKSLYFTGAGLIYHLP